MSKKTTFYLVTAVFIAVFGVSSVLFEKFVLANTTISVSVAKDWCKNIAGAQSSIPAGMLVDSNGNCYTPPPPPVDLCLNIPGAQSTVPSGYYSDPSKNCFPQPTPPVDVCPNLTGVQVVVPDGYVNDEFGNCVPEPIDQCINIDGVQFAIPAGMERDDIGVCATPPSIVTPNDEVAPPPVVVEEPSPDPLATPSTARQPAPGAPPANVPEFLAPAIAPIVESIPEPVKEFVRTLPPVVAQTFPYYIFAVLGASALIFWLQAVQEIRASGILFGILKRERSIAEQKDNFIALASHYLRTPLTLMTNGLDTIAALGEASKESIETLRAPIKGLENDISNILNDVEHNEQLRAIEQPLGTDTEPHSFLRSAYFWGPVAGSITLVLAANFLLGIVGEVQLGTLNLIAQILVLAMVAFLLYTSLRNRHTRRRNRALQQQSLDHERAIDDARTAFLEQSTATLQRGLSRLGSLRSAINGAPSAKFFDEGYARFASMLTKFTLLGQVRTGSQIPPEEFDLRMAVEDVLSRYQGLARSKNITINNTVNSTNLVQRRALLEFVIGSLIDNAIKFTGEGGTIQVDATPSKSKLSIRVADTGAGIPSEKIPQLFKPFSRADSAVDFNYEGLGFSLFLDKIIMEYMGGDIDVHSEQNNGSVFTLTASNETPPQASTQSMVRPAVSPV